LPEFGFKPDSSYALAKESYALGELRKMMPFGTHWFTNEKVNNVSSNIGSMLYAESAMTFNRALMQLRLQESRVPVYAVGDYLKQWFNASLRIEPGIHSDGYLQRCLAAYISVSNAKDKEVVSTLAKEVFNLPVTVSSASPPPFFVYKLPLTDNETSASFEETPVEYRGYLSYHEYQSCMYKRFKGEWVARCVPGFPVKAVPPDYCPVSVSTYRNLTSTQQRHMVAVRDGGIYVLPILQYFFSLRINLSTSSPKSMYRVIKAALPVGVKLFIDTEFTSVGD
jgi:hypothetical protein